VSPQLKLLPPSKPRLGLYLRPGRNDHTVFQQLLAEDKAVSGLVLDARHLDRQRELRASFIDNGVHAVLDVDFMEMATPGGSILAGLADLPWARFAAASADELHRRTGRQLAAAIADAVADGGFSAVLAPTHLLSSGRDAFFGAWHLTLDAIVRAGPCPVPLAALGQRSGVTNPKPQAMN
jgi:hypothetical protein